MSALVSLAETTVVVTRRPEDVRDLVHLIEARGGEVACVPMIRFAPPADAGPLRSARRDLASFHWLILTSRYAASALLEGVPPPTEGRPRIASLGQSTSRVIQDLGWPVDMDGGGNGADALAERMAVTQALTGQRLLYPRSDRARSKLPQILRRTGATVQEVDAYRTLPPEPASGEALLHHLEGEPAIFVFASPSAVAHLDAILAKREHQGGAPRAEVWAQMTVVSIGPTTSRALHGMGAERLHEATSPNDIGLVGAIEVARTALPAVDAG